jgi:hypothetical protein
MPSHPLPLPQTIAPLSRGPERRRPSTRSGRIARRVKRFAGTPRGKAALIAAACAVVLLVGLLASGFLSPAAPRPSVAPLAGGSSAASGPSGLPSAPAASKSKRRVAGSATGPVADPLQALRASLPDNPLNHLHGPGVHNVVVSATSALAIPSVGYLVPTGLSAPYGSVRPNTRTWSISQKALGGGYLAAIFVQAGATGIPITCRVTVDGKTTNSETTAGPYGRAVCLG